MISSARIPCAELEGVAVAHHPGNVTVSPRSTKGEFLP